MDENYKEDEIQEKEKGEPEFSLYQSNILYLLFMSGAVICLALDITVQINRRGEAIMESRGKLTLKKIL